MCAWLVGILCTTMIAAHKLHIYTFVCAELTESFSKNCHMKAK